MKIYINNFNIDILSSIMKSLAEHFVSCESYIQIYSEDGLYQIDNSSIKKQKIIDKEIEIFKEYYDDFTLIADPSHYTLEKVNKLPCNHIVSKVKRCFFTPDKKLPIKLVIEGTALEETSCNKLSNIYNMDPYDIYLEVGEYVNLNDELVKREIIVFLSLLN
jgi:hypothetical protein